MKVTRRNAYRLNPAGLSPSELARARRFVIALRYVKRRKGLSERGLARRLGVTVGTTHKYFTYAIGPGAVRGCVLTALAQLACCSLDAGWLYLNEGRRQSGLPITTALQRIRTSRQDQELAAVLLAVQEALAKRGHPQTTGACC